MHPLVQLSVQDWLASVDEKTQFAEEALQLLAAKFPNSEHEDRARCELMLLHARAVLQHVVEPASGMSNRATIPYKVAWFDWRQGRYISANEGAREAYEIAEKL